MIHPSLNKNFEQFKLLLGECQYKFSIICLTVKPGVRMKHFAIILTSNWMSMILFIWVERINVVVGYAYIVHNSLSFKTRNDLSIINEEIENLCIEIINKKTKKYYCNTCYQQLK